MNILVVDVAASESGALTILKLYRDMAAADSDNHYYFCVSSVELVETDNVTRLSFPWVKKSWFHRLWFDHIVCKKLISKYSIQEILSLQNTAVPHTTLPQMIYLHQSLPFVEYRYRLIENPKLWIYQNIISKMIFSSLKRANRIIVQTNWMKRAVIERTGVDGDIITIEPPQVRVVEGIKFSWNKWEHALFYPATGFDYKNHRCVLEALCILKQRGAFLPEAIFTLTQEQLPANCLEYYEQVKEHVKLIGFVSRDEVLHHMSKTILVFPSYIESYPLPLQEAVLIGTPVVASNCRFSHEILDGYDDAQFFDPFSPEQLADLIENFEKENSNEAN